MGIGPHTARLILEAALPPGDARWTRDEKARVIRAVLLEGYSYLRAARLIGTTDTTAHRWVDETEDRIRAADPALLDAITAPPAPLPSAA